MLQLRKGLGTTVHEVIVSEIQTQEGQSGSIFQCSKQGGGGILGNRISCLKPPRAKFKKGGRFGGGGVVRGVFAARGYCPREGHPGPQNRPPNEIHSVGHLRTVGYAAQV